MTAHENNLTHRESGQGERLSPVRTGGCRSPTTVSMVSVDKTLAKRVVSSLTLAKQWRVPVHDNHNRQSHMAALNDGDRTMCKETPYGFNERRGKVEQQFREDPRFDYEPELAEEVMKELRDGFEEYSQTAKYLGEKQDAKSEDTEAGREFDDEAYEKDEWDEYYENNHDDVEERLREPHEEEFQRRVDEEMV